MWSSDAREPSLPGRRAAVVRLAAASLAALALAPGDAIGVSLRHARTLPDRGAVAA